MHLLQQEPKIFGDSKQEFPEERLEQQLRVQLKHRNQYNQELILFVPNIELEEDDEKTGDDDVLRNP